MTSTEILRRIRYADPADADAIFALGRSEPAFKVSGAIPFYEHSELVEWATDRRENILAVVEENGVVVGFLFCKVISHHWAMVDNFYIAPSGRTVGIAAELRDWLVADLRQRGLSYLTCLIREDHVALVRLVRRLGFDVQKQYTWCELFL
jgi:ribosomal protein S18 acetylase RimI-like enzyme